MKALVDTSVFVDAERRALQALEKLEELMAADGLAVSAVTVHELLRSPRLPAAWREFYALLFSLVEVLPVSLEAARLAADLYAARGRDAARDTGDALIAGTALAAGLRVFTSDEGFLSLLPDAVPLRPS